MKRSLRILGGYRTGSLPCARMHAHNKRRTPFSLMLSSFAGRVETRAVAAVCDAPKGRGALLPLPKVLC